MKRIVVAIAMSFVSNFVGAQAEVDRMNVSGNRSVLWPQAGPTCTAGTALDDGTFESGYRIPSAADVRFVQRLTPSEYPASLTRVCACWKVPAPDAMPFTFLIYDDNGPEGTPGTLLGSLPASVTIDTASGEEFVGRDCASLNLLTPSGSVYVGVRWNAADHSSFFVCSDETFETPLAVMYVSDDGGLTWNSVPSQFGDNARALGLRGEFVATEDPDPPAGSWLTTTALPGYQFKSRIDGNRNATQVNDCVPETICLAGAIANRTEAFVRIIGPRQNGFLWPEVIRFTVAQVELWVQKTTGGPINYYRLPGVSQNSDVLNGIVDREGFLP
ncbi:MAG TPA: hypothetical protein VGS22_01660 [Thermoanaerobaculia bacterium]|nr:hypothetical protein [Thermoanaerobaculia bacterium]